MLNLTLLEINLFKNKNFLAIAFSRVFFYVIFFCKMISIAKNKNISLKLFSLKGCIQINWFLDWLQFADLTYNVAIWFRLFSELKTWTNNCTSYH